MTTVSDHGSAWVPNAEAFGTRLAMVRQHEGWNAKEAAIACSLPPQSWRNWEAGKRPSDLLAVCRAISDRTGVDLMWLLTGQAASSSGGGGAIISASLDAELQGLTCGDGPPSQSFAEGVVAA